MDRIGAHYNPNNVDPRDIVIDDQAEIAGISTNYGMPPRYIRGSPYVLDFKNN